MPLPQKLTEKTPSNQQQHRRRTKWRLRRMFPQSQQKHQLLLHRVTVALALGRNTVLVTLHFGAAGSKQTKERREKRKAHCYPSAPAASMAPQCCVHACTTAVLLHNYTQLPDSSPLATTTPPVPLPASIARCQLARIAHRASSPPPTASRTVRASGPPNAARCPRRATLTLEVHLATRG